jgi:hypothetical protein
VAIHSKALTSINTGLTPVLARTNTVKEHKIWQEQEDPLVQLAHVAHKGHQAQEVLPVHKDLEDLRVVEVPRVYQARLLD